MEVRKSMVAGMFYPDSPATLTKQLAEFFSYAQKKALIGQVKALIVPHAGYMYSGQIAADAYKQIEGEVFESVVVIAPFHGFFKGVTVYPGDAYETPLGVIPIDRELSEALASKHPSVYSSTVGHTGTGGRGEHSLEVQLPFLQLVLGKFNLVAMIMGDQEESTIRAAAEVLAAALKGKNVLMVASTDLSHFHSDKVARKLDKNFEDALASYDTNKIIHSVTSRNAEACGFGPTAAVVEATRRLGGEKVEIISYDTSGSVTGDFDEVVGYLSAVIVGKKTEVKRKPLMGMPLPKKVEGYSAEEKELLKSVARHAVESKALGEKFDLPSDVPHQLHEKRGVFVTLERKGDLRGCIGLVQARLPLIDAVYDMARAAAFEDPRFNPVDKSELAELEYEISILTPLSRVDNIDEIEVGKHGLMIRMEMHSGLLLPQVATEYGWDRITFLEQTCLKAGLPKSSYKNPQAQIYKFSVEKF